MDVKELNDRTLWDEALLRFSYPPFTQVWTWGETQRALGKKVVRLFTKQNKTTLMCQWVEERRGPLTYWFAPQGPVISQGAGEKVVQEFLQSCRSLLPGGARICFDRCEPRWRSTNDLMETSNQLSVPFKRVHSMNPAVSAVTPLQGSAEELFETFHKKTRYNIRLAQRHDVQVRLGTEKDWPTFLTLMKETAQRDGIVFHTDSYLTTVYQTMKRFGHARLRVAEYRERALVINLEILVGDTVMYLYGASSSENRHVMAPFALQWSAISSALAEGFRWYDFGGANPADPASLDYRPTWEGITRFKEQWGTRRHVDPGTFDAPRHPLLYKLLVRR